MHANGPSYWRFLKKSANWVLTLWTTVVDSSLDFDYDAYAVNAASSSILLKNCPHSLRRLILMRIPFFFFIFVALPQWGQLRSENLVWTRQHVWMDDRHLHAGPRGLGAGVSRTRVFVSPQHMSLCQLQNVKSCRRWAHKTPAPTGVL